MASSNTYTIYIANRTMDRSKAKEKAIPSKSGKRHAISSNANNSALAKITKLSKQANKVIGQVNGVLSGGVGKIAKSVPIVSTIIAVAETIMNIGDKFTELHETLSGDYKWVGGWKSFRKSFGNVMNPLNLIYTMTTQNIEREKERITYEENVKVRGGFLGDYNI